MVKIVLLIIAAISAAVVGIYLEIKNINNK